MLAWRSAKTWLENGKKRSVLRIFGRCGPFPQDFGQVIEKIIKYFLKIVIVCCILAYPMFFILL